MNSFGSPPTIGPRPAVTPVPDAGDKLDSDEEAAESGVTMPAETPDAAKKPATTPLNDDERKAERRSGYARRAKEALKAASSETRRRGRPKKDPANLVVKYNTTLRAKVIRELNDRIDQFNEPQLVEVPASYFLEAAVLMLLDADDSALTRILKKVQDSRYSSSG
ncbi:MAG: hypothetical protein AAFQ77_03225 [Myxococcota bacterium]